MTLTPRVLLCVAAAVCFFIALIVALGSAQTNEAAWLDGGLLALALSFVVP